MGDICTILFQVNINLDLDSFRDKLVNKDFFPGAVTINTLENQISQITTSFEDTIEIRYGSLVYKFNQNNMGFIRINRGWIDFLTFPPTTEITREICLEAMEYFKSKEAIYLSDMYSFDYFYSKLSWSDLKKSLARRLGPPPQSIGEIYKEYEEHIEAAGYFIEIR
ncbi:hypothetical protein ACFO9Q_16040 [Paenibacillus sp. GCM10023252]|uniref:hypothetical protein n=1 Tax=Paenibacillus sp. GCM10023252 TaxID=3252649 RepID=UPI00361BEC36